MSIFFTAPLRPTIIKIICRPAICFIWIDSPVGIYDFLVVTARPLAIGQGAGQTTGTVTVIYPRDGCPYVTIAGLNPDSNYLFEVTAQSGRLALSPTDSQQAATGRLSTYTYCMGYIRDVMDLVDLNCFTELIREKVLTPQKLDVE